MLFQGISARRPTKAAGGAGGSGTPRPAAAGLP